MNAVYSDLSTTGYRTPGHPEAPERVSRSYERLAAAGHRVERPPSAATEADVGLLHGPDHFKTVRDGTFHDPDTPHHPGIERIALISLSGALAAADSAARGEPAFSLMRPPGHHAGRERVAGFCYFNNLALACARLRTGRETDRVAAPGAASAPGTATEENGSVAALQGVSRDRAGRSPSGLDRVAILDIDVHHGDGTEELMTRRDGIFFCSLHQSPLYPGTGLESHDNCVNVPLPPGTGEDAYLAALEPALEALLAFKPRVLAVSAGFDTYRECPIAQFRLEKKTYRRIGALIAETKLPRFAVLEGGYAADLPILLENFLEGFFR